MTAFSPSNLQIQPYVNGALYSILSIPAIREEARAMVRNAPDACVGPIPATEQSSPGSAQRLSGSARTPRRHRPDTRLRFSDENLVLRGSLAPQ